MLERHLHLASKARARAAKARSAVGTSSSGTNGGSGATPTTSTTTASKSASANNGATGGGVDSELIKGMQQVRLKNDGATTSSGHDETTMNSSTQGAQHSVATLQSLKWKALVRRGRARRALLEALVQDAKQALAHGSEEEGQVPKADAAKDAKRQGELAREAREDFEQALKLDPQQAGTVQADLQALLSIESAL